MEAGCGWQGIQAPLLHQTFFAKYRFKEKIKNFKAATGRAAAPRIMSMGSWEDHMDLKLIYPGH